jgi:NTE family protein
VTARPCGGLVLAWALALAPALASAQTPTRHPTIGLALSGGAARGLAHIGVLKVLAQAGLPVDLVAGTSMGSVVGSLYAVGYAPAALDSIFTAQDWFRLLTDQIDRRDLPVDHKFAEDRYLLTLPIYRRGIHLPRSVVAGQRVSELLTRLTWSVHGVRDFHQLPLPFTAVATDLETGRAVVLDHGFLPDAVRASMAMPSVFSPVELDGRTLIDGGVIRNLPAEDARALGADLLICSDVTDPLEPRDSIVSFVDVLAQSVSFRVWDSEAAERSRCDVLIIPDVRAFSTFGFAQGRELIARGEAAARAAVPAIRAKLAGRSVPPRPQRPVADPESPESVVVTAVRFAPGGRVSETFLAHALGVRPSTWVSRATLSRKIERLYATGLFANVRYRLDSVVGERPEGRVLTVVTSERPAGQFGVGLRYESRYKASVLLSSTLGPVRAFGSGASLDARLGQQIRVGLTGWHAVGDAERNTLTLGAEYTRSPFDLYASGRRVAEARVELGGVSASLAHTLGTAARVSVRAKTEYAHWAQEVAAVDSPAVDRTFASVAAELDLDTYDHGVFPRQGVGFRGVSEWAAGLGAPTPGFSHQFAELAAYLPVRRTVSLWVGATAGASGGKPPPHYLFFVGGANRYYLFPDRDLAFVGLERQERHGRYVQQAELGAQWEFVPDVFARLHWNAGTVLDRWSFDPAQYLDGVAVEVGMRTVAGRLSMSVAGRAHSAPMVTIDLGGSF